MAELSSGYRLPATAGQAQGIMSGAREMEAAASGAGRADAAADLAAAMKAEAAGRRSVAGSLEAEAEANKASIATLKQQVKQQQRAYQAQMLLRKEPPPEPPSPVVPQAKATGDALVGAGLKLWALSQAKQFATMGLAMMAGIPGHGGVAGQQAYFESGLAGVGSAMGAPRDIARTFAKTPVGAAAIQGFGGTPLGAAIAIGKKVSSSLGRENE